MPRFPRKTGLVTDLAVDRVSESLPTAWDAAAGENFANFAVADERENLAFWRESAGVPRSPSIRRPDYSPILSNSMSKIRT